nr:hypothetical protein [Zooshikella ganghwensis]
MIEAYNNLLKLESFISATQQFEALVVYLASQGACLEQHGNIEQYLQTAGNELLRRLLQGHLDHRATHERPRQSVTGADGIRQYVLSPVCSTALGDCFWRGDSDSSCLSKERAS